jgi:hypothetical protein
VSLPQESAQEAWCNLLRHRRDAAPWRQPLPCLQFAGSGLQGLDIGLCGLNQSSNAATVGKLVFALELKPLSRIFQLLNFLVFLATQVAGGYPRFLRRYCECHGQVQAFLCLAAAAVPRFGARHLQSNPMA